ncbi:glycosyltransferase [Cohnella kolymensis]|uniref:glycosyltransferase n=1 Tax=Cohnella kolymensis TaxID=1590652 RepID=UPI000697F6D7|nr:glycosyltransferase [Cohnella kolymensis]
MKKKVLISMYSLHIGGAERSLIGLLESFDYDQYEVDLFLYRHEGEFLAHVPKEVNLLPPIRPYTTFERPILEVIREGYLYLGTARVLAKLKTRMKHGASEGLSQTYRQMQYTWKLSLPRLPKIEKQYDTAISFLGPHYFVLDKVQAKVKFGWNHTDYFTIVNPDKRLDESMWRRLDYIVSVSEDCRASFLKVFPHLHEKAVVIENIISTAFVREQSKVNVKAEMPDDGAIKICSVGRFSDAKGFDLAVVACKKLIEAGYNIKWYIVGYGGEEELIKRLIQEQDMTDRFILLGKKTNPYPYIKECDIYCQPSRYEGKAVTVREAQILGKPVLITNFPTAKSQVRDGLDGLITPLGIDGIAQGLKRLIDNRKLRDTIAGNTLLNDYSNIHEINTLCSLFQCGERTDLKEVN